MSGLVKTVGNIFNPPSPPKPEKPAPMPVADSAEAESARRRRTAAMRQRSGRASTILSEGGSDRRLGG